MHRISFAMTVPVALSLAGVLHAQTSVAADTTDSLHTRPTFTTTTTFTQAELQQLPIDDPLQAFGFAPGVVERSGYLGIASSSDFAVQSGPAGDAAFFIDGAPARLETFGGLGIELPLNAIARASLSTGPIGADVGAPRNAVVDFETRRGGDRVAGAAHAETDGLFGSGSTVGYNRFDGSLGGPLPGVSGLTWFVAGSAVGQQSRYRGLGAANVATYVPYGIDTTVTVPVDAGMPLTDSVNVSIPDFVQWGGTCGGVGNPNTTQGQQITANYGQACQGLHRPRDWTSDLRGVAAIRYAHGARTALSLTGVSNLVQQRDFPANDISAPGLQTGTRRTARLLVANWEQALGRLHGGPVALHVNFSVSDVQEMSGPLTTATEVATRSPSLGIETTRLAFLGADSVPLSNIAQLISNVRENTGLRVPFLLRQDFNASQPFRLDPYGVATGWPTSGNNGVISELDEKHVTGAVAVRWSPGVHHTVRAGVDGDRSDVAYYTASLTSQFLLDLYHVQPRRVGVFVADEYRADDLVLDVGLRRESYTPGGAFPNTPGRTFTIPGWTGIDSIDAQHFHTGAVQSFWMPGARARLVLARHTQLRAGVTRAVLPPDVGDQFARSNIDISVTSSGNLFGADIQYLTSTNVTLGITQDVGAWVLDGAYHHLSGPTQYAARYVQYSDPTTGGVYNLNTLIPEYGATTELDARIGWTPSPTVDVSASYAHLSTLGVGTHVFAALAMVSAPARPPRGVFGDLVRGGRVVLGARLTSGGAYTPCYNSGTGQLASAGALCTTGYDLGPINSGHIPWTKLLDLRITKRVAGFGGHWSAFLDVRNLLNTENLTNAFVETGTDTNQAYEMNHFVQPSINLLQAEAPTSAHLANGGVDLRTCQGWTSQTQMVDCYALHQTENRFGNGDGVFTQAEQVAAFGAYYNFLYGPWAFHGPGRTARVGIRFDF
ncbi:MAG TPA: hypothetical protein VJ992_12930 [Gemmatimonadales bacterium]|nr:hypothetical protein [Gemmatimonadales bacterium]